MLDAVINNPLWILVVLGVGGAVVRGLFWLRDVQTMKTGWAQFTTKTFPDFAQEIRNDIRGLQDEIKRIFERLPENPRTLRSDSPARLSEYGQKIADSLRAKEWATSTATPILPEVVNKRPFEIEEFSRVYVSERLDPKATERVAACAYEFGIDRDSVRSVLWVVLRDELLQRVQALHRK